MSETAAPERHIPYLTAQDVARVEFAEAVAAIERALASGLDVAAAPARANVPVRSGQLLLMPGEVGNYVGVKVASVAPDNPARGLPRIQGSFLLMDSATLAPVALIDGIALTALRTPAVSAAAVKNLRPTLPARLMIFGAGPQAAGHARALASSIEISEIAVIARDPDHAGRLAARLATELRVAATVGDRGDLAAADVVVCATTSRTPLVDAGDVAPGVVVVAVGSHEPDAAELGADLLAEAHVVVEDPATALREAGDVVMAVAAGKLSAAQLVPLSYLVAGRAVADTARPRVFKSVGMAWEDVVVAAAVFARATSGDRG